MLVYQPVRPGAGRVSGAHVSCMSRNLGRVRAVGWVRFQHQQVPPARPSMAFAANGGAQFPLVGMPPLGRSLAPTFRGPRGPRRRPAISQWPSSNRLSVGRSTGGGPVYKVERVWRCRKSVAEPEPSNERTIRDQQTVGAGPDLSGPNIYTRGSSPPEGFATRPIIIRSAGSPCRPSARLGPSRPDYPGLVRPVNPFSESTRLTPGPGYELCSGV